MNSVCVYCEIESGKILDVSFELLTKGKTLAQQLNVKLEALVIGKNLSGMEKRNCTLRCGYNLFCRR